MEETKLYTEEELKNRMLDFAEWLIHNEDKFILCTHFKLLEIYLKEKGL